MSAFLRLCLCLCLGVSGRSVSAQDSGDPFALIFLNGNVDPVHLQEIRRLRTGNVGDLKAASLPSDIFRFIVAQHPTFRFCRGNAHYTLKNGTHVTCHFLTVPNRDAFTAFVGEKQDAGKSVFKYLDPDKVTVSRPSRTFRRGDTEVTEQYDDISCRYINGLVCVGQKEIFDLDLTKVVQAIPEARDYHAYWRIWPDNAAESARERLVSSYVLPWAVKKQRRDQEPRHTHVARHALLDIAEVVLDGLVNDVEEIVVTTRGATSLSGFRRHYVLTLEPNSKFRQFVADLQPNRSREPVITSQPATGSAFLHVRLPEEVQKFLLACIEAIILPNSKLHTDLAAAVSSGRLQLEVVVAEDGQGTPVLEITVPVAASDTPAKDVMSSTIGELVRNEEQTGFLPFEDMPELAWLRDYKINMKIDDGMLVATASREAIVETTVLRETEKGDHTLFHLEANFERWVHSKPDSPIRHLLQQLSDYYYRFEISVVQRIRQASSTPVVKAIPDPERWAVLPDDDASWTVSLDVRSIGQGRKIEIEYNVGTNLYYFLERHRLSITQIHKH